MPTITDLTGTTWQINKVPDLTGFTTNIEYNVSFTVEGYLTSGPDDCISIMFSSSSIQYYLNSSTYKQAYSTSQSWDAGLELITFTGGTDVTNSALIEWLSDNATQSAVLVADSYSTNHYKASVSNISNAYTDTNSNTYAAVTFDDSTTTSSVYIDLLCHPALSTSLPQYFTINSIRIRIKVSSTNAASSAIRAILKQSSSSGTNAVTSSFTPSSDVQTAVIYSLVSSSSTSSSGWLNGGKVFSKENDGFSWGARIYLNQEDSSSPSVTNIYGAEFIVNYTEVPQYTITQTLSGSGVLNPSGTQSIYENESYSVTITPTVKSNTVTVTNNGTDVTSQLLVTYDTSSSSYATAPLGSYTLVSGSFSGSGESYFSGLVGKDKDATVTTSNYYSSSNGTSVIFTYDIPFSTLNIPTGSAIVAVNCFVSGHPENTSNNSEYMCVQIVDNALSKVFSEEYNFKSSGTTSNTIYELKASTIPTLSELEGLKLKCTLGYYGGALNGASWEVYYLPPGGQLTVAYYTYSFIVTGNTVLAVTISGASGKIMIKKNGVWTEYSSMYRKSNGSWELVSPSSWSTYLNNLSKIKIIESTR